MQFAEYVSRFMQANEWIQVLIILFLLSVAFCFFSLLALLLAKSKEVMIPVIKKCGENALLFVTVFLFLTQISIKDISVLIALTIEKILILENLIFSIFGFTVYLVCLLVAKVLSSTRKFLITVNTDEVSISAKESFISLFQTNFLFKVRMNQ